MFREFVVRGWIDGRPTAVRWIDGRLEADRDVRARAEIVVALGEQSPGGLWTRASLDDGPRAALFTVLRALSQVDCIELDRRDTAGGHDAHRVVECLRWAAVITAGRLDLPHVVVAAPVELDASAAPAFDAALRAIQANAEVVVDLGELRFCGASGLRALLAARRRHTDAGGSFRLRNPPTIFARLIDACGLHGHFAHDHDPSGAR